MIIKKDIYIVFLLSIISTTNVCGSQFVVLDDGKQAHVTKRNKKKSNSGVVGKLIPVNESLVLPKPNTIQPIPDDKNFAFLKSIVKRDNIIVGDYSYYYDEQDVNNFETHVLYHFEALGDKLIIGKFCQIGTSAKFIMNGGNHKFDGYTSYPLLAFGDNWRKAPISNCIKGDTIIGNDVWIGTGAVIMPGVSIGSGAIIGAYSFVTKNVKPYRIVGGAPAKVIRKRFKKKTIKYLLKLSWWDFSHQIITCISPALIRGDRKEIKKILNKM